MIPKIDVPPEVKDCEVIASVSGGKDSTAMCLALREAEVPHRMVFADTGWEAPQTYEHLDVLRKHLGPIVTVSRKSPAIIKEGGMVDRARSCAGFPTRLGRWCTPELKLIPIKTHEGEVSDIAGRDIVSALGVRGAESKKRAKLPVWSWSDEWDGWVWRPILNWSIADVIAIHHRHKMPLNPLYELGMDRVGCWPCIFSRKNEIRRIAEIDPARIDYIERLEEEFTQSRAERNGDTSGRYKHPKATFFMPIERGRPVGIREIVTWARTTHGGRQLPLLPEPPEGGCMRWGLCEPPGDDEE